MKAHRESNHCRLKVDRSQRRMQGKELRTITTSRSSRWDVFIQTADSASHHTEGRVGVPDSERSLGLRVLGYDSSLSPLSCRNSRDHILRREYQQPPTALIIIITMNYRRALYVLLQELEMMIQWWINYYILSSVLNT